MSALGLMIAGPTTGVGKTTVAVGLSRCLTEDGARVATFKVGPDFIDASYLSVAAGRPCRTLDAFMSGPDLIAPLYRAGSVDCEFAVIEAVAGLFDGERLESDFASSAHIARILKLPVVLVVDASHSGRSLAALITGFRDFDNDLEVAGVILNRIWSSRSARALTKLLGSLGVPVLGAIPTDPNTAIDERYLGLIPSQHDIDYAEEKVQRAAATVRQNVDLAAVWQCAQRIEPGPEWSAPLSNGPSRTVAVATGPAFSFCYPENLEALATLGAELAFFDPLSDELPHADCLYLCGGFPERYSQRLTANQPLLTQIRRAAVDGMPILAECGGLMYLCQSLDGHRMTGVIPYSARMTPELTLSYVKATALADSAATKIGDACHGHVYHHSKLVAASQPLPPLWRIEGVFSRGNDGVAGPSISASYVHTHWARDITVAQRLLQSDVSTLGTI